MRSNLMRNIGSGDTGGWWWMNWTARHLNTGAVVVMTNCPFSPQKPGKRFLNGPANITLTIFFETINHLCTAIALSIKFRNKYIFCNFLVRLNWRWKTKYSLIRWSFLLFLCFQNYFAMFKLALCRSVVKEGWNLLILEINSLMGINVCMSPKCYIIFGAQHFLDKQINRYAKTGRYYFTLYLKHQTRFFNKLVFLDGSSSGLWQQKLQLPVLPY